MDAALFERLLNEEEGTALDFKRDQYPFSKATEEEKSELLKDILAFTNAWRRVDAYILVGVEDVRGGRSNVVGVTDHLDDHSLQQFVTHLTNRPPHFSYEAFTFEGKQVGIIKIDDRQARPFYLRADYGKLKKKVVYVRRGSSTCEADLDEVARMGTPVVQDEADLRLYHNLWEKLFELRRAVGQLVEPLSSTAVVRHETDFIDLFNAYQTVVSKGEPFMSKSVFDPAKKIVTLARGIHGNIGAKESLSRPSAKAAGSDWLATERERLDQENLTVFKEIDRLYQEVEVAISRRVTS
jgi:hypothetical protein